MDKDGSAVPVEMDKDGSDVPVEMNSIVGVLYRQRMG